MDGELDRLVEEWVEELVVTLDMDQSGSVEGFEHLVDHD